MSAGARPDGAAPAGTTPGSGGTQRSHEFPEYDVVLDVPDLCVDRVFLKADSVTATINLNARLANLMRVIAGAEVLIGRVDLRLTGRARRRCCSSISTTCTTSSTAGSRSSTTIRRSCGNSAARSRRPLAPWAGLVRGIVRGLLLETTRLASGETVQRPVDEATGAVVERTLSAGGRVVAERAIGSVLNLQPLRAGSATGPVR